MNEIVNFVLKKAKKPLSLESIYEKVELVMRKNGDECFELDEKAKQEIVDCLENGVNSYDYFLFSNGKYSLLSKTSFRKGVFYGNKSGDGYVLIPKFYVNSEGMKVHSEEKYVISRDQTNGAIDRDVVLIDTGSSIAKPRVVNVIERTLDNIQGEVYRIGANYFVKPIDKKKQGLLIALEGEAIEGQIVSVKLNQQTSNNAYIGTITRVFSHANDPDADILFEAFKCGIDVEFSEDSLKQLETIPDKVLDMDRIGRCDLTDWEIFTIDGDDTKDIDDALSCTILPNGNYLVGVHIADVAHYVPKGSALDKDAFKRGNSYYLGGKVIPMLPQKLSNGICSLNPYVERLAKSCIMEVTPEGKVVRYDIKPTIIRSRLKMTYGNVNKILKEGIIPEGYEEHVDTLCNLRDLAAILRNNRLKAGAMEFDRPELHIDMDEEHNISGFSLRRCDVGENLIEEFMLLANETVDKHIVSQGYPCLHRVHDTPNLERLGDYFKLLDAVNMPFNNYSPEECACAGKALQELGEHIKQNERLSSVLSLGLVKCMSRAKYSPTNIGHFGLAKENYCHYTSPIRRYSDLVIHRTLDNIYEDSDDLVYSEEDLLEIGSQTTKTEKVSDEAEDNVLRMKCSEYMAKHHLGDEFEGVITGVSDKNLTIQLDNLIEGRVKTKSLKGPYIYNPESFTLVSVDGNENYFLGDCVRVRVKAASKEEKTIDFEILEKIYEVPTRDNDESNKALVYTYKKEKQNRAYFN